MRTKTLAVLAILVTAGVSAQTLTMGNSVSSGNAGWAEFGDVVRTAVDLTHPANATGTINSATFYWGSGSCYAVARVKVFRRVGDSFTLVDQRGPFNVVSNLTTVTLSPPISVRQGDLIGLTRLQNCGNPTVTTPGYDASYISVAGDATSFSYSADTVFASRLMVYATGTATEVVIGVLPSVASNPGRHGTYYHTLVQALAFYSFEPDITGTFVFHQKGVPGGPSDPSMDFSIPGGEVVSWPDLLQTMGASGNPGSIDVVVPWGEASFMIGAQVYNDQGAAGTSGFREELVKTSNQTPGSGTYIFTAGATGYLFGPADAGKYRSNIAIRSLDPGVEATLQPYHADGSAAGSGVQVRYGPNTWDQQTWDVMTGATLQSGDFLRISVSRGSAIFENSITDQITGDSADVLARVVGVVL